VEQEGFIVAPALDVLEGRCVRLREGVRERVTVEGGDPVDAARRFAREGARLLHLVDLDGAFAGRPTEGLVERVASAVDVPVQVGGGLRTPAAVERALAAGAARAIVGTAAVSPDFLRDVASLGDRVVVSPDFLRDVASLGDRVVVAIDVRDGRVATDGWTDAAGDLTPAELARRCAVAGIARLLVTNTRRDGALAGPDTELLEEVLAVGLPVLAAGGIASLDDLRAVKAIGCEGAIAGSALWLGRFTLADALASV
jgi:phosphoribosylformimino-5-aminoimidazole carboxamide ribotide isomerase